MKKTIVGLLLLGLSLFSFAQNKSYPESPAFLKADSHTLIEASYHKDGKDVHNFVKPQAAALIAIAQIPAAINRSIRECGVFPFFSMEK